MAGETLAHFNPFERSVGKLWDGWLQIMEMLDKAQKLEAKAGSPLSTKALNDVEEMVNRQGIVRGDRDSGPGIRAGARCSLPRLITFAREVLDAVADGPAQDRRGDRLRQEA